MVEFPKDVLFRFKKVGQTGSGVLVLRMVNGVSLRPQAGSSSGMEARLGEKIINDYECDLGSHSRFYPSQL